VGGEQRFKTPRKSVWQMDAVQDSLSPLKRPDPITSGERSMSIARYHPDAPLLRYWLGGYGLLPGYRHPLLALIVCSGKPVVAIGVDVNLCPALV
jgi:hypothetical protein